jgi:heme oxygenase
MRLLEALRHHTRQQHEALHAHPLLTGLSDSTLTLSDFHHILLAFEAYYSHAEAACAAGWPEAVPNAPVLTWLGSDLAQHRLQSHAAHIAFVHPPIDTRSKLAGYLYTKQGSTLGGHVISKHLERQLGLIPRLDQWFFAGYGHDNGPNWKAFTAHLDDLDDVLNPDEVVGSACRAFETIAWFCDALLDLKQAASPLKQTTLRHEA